MLNTDSILLIWSYISARRWRRNGLCLGRNSCNEE